MRKNWLVILLFVLPVMLYFGLQSLISGGQKAASLNLENGSGAAYLPVVFSPMPTPEPEGINGSFEEGWTDMTDRVQLPNYWELYRVPVGKPLFDSTDTASGTCECKHLLNDQLPEEQQFGGSDALILDGFTVYKLFGVYEKWGSELSQTINGLPPGSSWRLTVPIRVHLHDDPGEWSAESSVWVNDIGYWANGFQMGNENWCKHEQVFVVPADGKAEIAIRVKAKWALPKDFFIDDIRLQPAGEPTPHQDLDWCRENPSLMSYQAINSER